MFCFKKWIFLLTLMYGVLGSSQNTVLKITDYYPLAHNNEWRYTAPEGWKDGDYISKIAVDSTNFAHFFKKQDTAITNTQTKTGHRFLHFDATGAAKMLRLDSEGLYYLGELFADGKSFVLFDEPVLWFPTSFTLGTTITETTPFTRFYDSGETTRGTYVLTQQIAGLETVTVPAGTFVNCIKVDFTNDWDFGKGATARSENSYYHAPGVGVVKASARFIIKQHEKTLIDRLVLPDLKKYTVN